MPSKLFDKAWILELPADNDEALNMLWIEFRELVDEGPKQGEEEQVRDLVRAYALLRAFGAARGIQVVVLDASDGLQQLAAGVKDAYQSMCHKARMRLDKRRNKAFLENEISNFEHLFGTTNNYEFSDENLEKIQKLTNELRGLIVKNTFLTENHRRRLLRRLEAMQAELHKGTSDIDRFWGFIGEMGIVAKKFGEDVEPLVQRTREISEIVISVIAATERIALGFSPVKLLEAALGGSRSKKSDSSPAQDA